MVCDCDLFFLSLILFLFVTLLYTREDEDDIYNGFDCTCFYNTVPKHFYNLNKILLCSLISGNFTKVDEIATINMEAIFLSCNFYFSNGY